jgi:hypothetical protein
MALVAVQALFRLRWGAILTLETDRRSGVAVMIQLESISTSI